MARPVPSPLTVVAATFDAANGRVRVELNRDPRQTPDAPSMLYPRHLRGPVAEVVYPIERRLLEILRFLMVDSLAVFFAVFEESDGKTYLVLLIAPPDEENRFGVINSGSHLVHVLGRLLGRGTQKDYALEFNALTNPDSATHIGFNTALARLSPELAANVRELLDAAFRADVLHLPTGD